MSFLNVERSKHDKLSLRHYEQHDITLFTKTEIIASLIQCCGTPCSKYNIEFESMEYISIVELSVMLP